VDGDVADVLARGGREAELEAEASGFVARRLDLRHQRCRELERRSAVLAYGEPRSFALRSGGAALNLPPALGRRVLQAPAEHAILARRYASDPVPALDREEPVLALKEEAEARVAGLERGVLHRSRLHAQRAAVG